MSNISPFLWFNDQAEQAAQFYTSVFPNSRVVTTTHYGDSGPGPKGSVMTVAFELEGQKFTALNGGPQFTFTEAVSFVVNCETQEEVDRYWSRLTADGGQPGPCGWLKDRFGLSWQIVPNALPRLLSDTDPAKSKRVMEAVMKMGKLDISALEAAAAR
jgi:predicted 3-demethylubiquinone-9 3-methyltransferase (glyoxalase superfamily)